MKIIYIEKSHVTLDISDYITNSKFMIFFVPSQKTI